MDGAQIKAIRDDLERAKNAPDRALLVLMDAMARIVSHLESEVEGRASVKVAIQTMTTRLEGYFDNEGRRHPGFFETVDTLTKETIAAKLQSERNGKLIKKGVFTVVAGLALQAAIWLLSHTHIGP